MRVIPLMAGLAIAMAACGGEQKTEDQQTMTPEQAAPVGEAPAATGTTHDVNMVLEGSTYKYVPSELSIKPGDVVRFHNVSGPPHNVSFWADSIPAGGAEVLQSGMPDQMGPLQGPLLTQLGATYSVSFANAPTGEYKFYCLPHLALGMSGKISVE